MQASRVVVTRADLGAKRARRCGALIDAPLEGYEGATNRDQGGEEES